MELCSALREGGLTPSLGLLRATRAATGLDLFVLIRPRGGDFLYSDEEFRIMQQDIRIAQAEDADGVVLGLLTMAGKVDVERTTALVQLAQPMEVTFHRAFDLTQDLGEALEDVIRTGAQRILTSGGAASATAGQAQLTALAHQAQDRVTLVAGGGVRPANIAALASATGLHEFHSSLRRTEASPMQFRAQAVHLGEPGADEYTRTVVLASDVEALVNAAGDL